VKVGDLVRCKTTPTDVGVVLREQGGSCLNVQVLYTDNRGMWRHWTPVEMLEVLSESR
jgi:hypothetical protein